MDPYARFTAAAAIVQTALSAASAELAAIDDPATRLGAASELVRLLRTEYEKAADARAVMAYIQWRDETISQAAIGNRAGVTKGRASQIIRTGKEIVEGTTG